ncbi:MAG: hypothetical protein ACOCQD_03245 [archaeon]
MKKVLPWVEYNRKAKKAKERVMRQKCSNCGRTMEEGGVSAFPGLCKECVE